MVLGDLALLTWPSWNPPPSPGSTSKVFLETFVSTPTRVLQAVFEPNILDVLTESWVHNCLLRPGNSQKGKNDLYLFEMLLTRQTRPPNNNLIKEKLTDRCDHNIWPLWFNKQVVKKRIFYGQADRKHLPLLPPLEVSFHGFFLVCLNLDYDSYVFWNGFYTRKKSFSSNYKNHHSSLLLLCHKMVG